MAVAVVSTQTATPVSGDDTISVSVTRGGSTDCYAICICNSDGTPGDVSAVRVNGSTTGVTRVISKRSASGGGFAQYLRATQYRLVAPPSGTYNVEADLDAINDELQLWVIQLSGVDQTNPVSDSDSDTASDEDSSAGPLSLTTVVDGMVIDVMNGGGFNGNDPSLSFGGGQTQQSTSTANAPYIQVGGSSKPATTTSTSVSASVSAIGETVYAHAYIAVAYAPAAGGGGVVIPKFMYNYRKRRA
jgi:hypothetical protein